MLSFLPILLFILSLFLNLKALSRNELKEKYLSEYILLALAWIAILVGLMVLMLFMNISWLETSMYLIGLNIVLRILSYIFHYQDGEIIFPIGYILSFIFFVIIYKFLQVSNLVDGIYTLCGVSVAVLGFINFVIKIKYRVATIFKYILFSTIILFICIALHKLIPDIYIFLLLLGSFLSIIYLLLMLILKNNFSYNPPKDISVRKILAGERILPYLKNRKKTTAIFTSEKLAKFVHNIPAWNKYFLELLNILLIIILITVYISYSLHTSSFRDNIIYRLVIFLFAYNVYNLKSINYNSLLQNISIFLGINITVYLMFFSLFNNLGEIVFFAIIFNIISAIVYLYSNSLYRGKVLKKSDYIIWFTVDMLFFVINMAMILFLDIPKDFLIAFALIYLGLRFLLGLYQAKKLK